LIFKTTVSRLNFNSVRLFILSRPILFKVHGRNIGFHGWEEIGLEASTLSWDFEADILDIGAS
jgi:hypothetical protein